MVVGLVVYEEERENEEEEEGKSVEMSEKVAIVLVGVTKDVCYAKWLEMLFVVLRSVGI